MAGETLPLIALLGIGFLILIIIALIIFLFVLWIMMIVDCAKRKFKDENEKVIWILVIVLASYIGAIVYYFVVKRADKH